MSTISSISPAMVPQTPRPLPPLSAELGTDASHVLKDSSDSFDHSAVGTLATRVETKLASTKVGQAAKKVEEKLGPGPTARMSAKAGIMTTKVAAGAVGLKLLGETAGFAGGAFAVGEGGFNIYEGIKHDKPVQSIGGIVEAAGGTMMVAGAGTPVSWAGAGLLVAGFAMENTQLVKDGAQAVAHVAQAVVHKTEDVAQKAMVALKNA